MIKSALKDSLPRMKKQPDTNVKVMRDSVIRISLKPGSERSENELQTLVDFFIYFNVFKNIYKYGDLMKLAYYAESRFCHATQTLFRQGDEPDGYYVIVKGRITGGFRKTNTLVAKYFEELDVLLEISSGMGFGEIAIIENKRRTISMRATKDTHLLFIRKDIYMDFACPTLIKQIQENINLLKTFEAFQKFSESRLREYCSISFERQHSSGSMLNEQGKLPTRLYIVKSGIIDVCRKINLENLSPAVVQRYSGRIKHFEFPLIVKVGTVSIVTRQFPDHQPLRGAAQKRILV